MLGAASTAARSAAALPISGQGAPAGVIGEGFGVLATAMQQHHQRRVIGEAGGDVGVQGEIAGIGDRGAAWLAVQGRGCGFRQRRRDVCDRLRHHLQQSAALVTQSVQS